MVKQWILLWVTFGACFGQEPHVLQPAKRKQHLEKARIVPRKILPEPRSGWLDRPRSLKANSSEDLYDEAVYRTFELTFEDPNWHEVLIFNYHADRTSPNNTYLRADLTVDGRLYKDVGVQYKGNSSFEMAKTLKKPIKITMDAFVPGQDLYGHDIITLNNGVWDPTLYREVICYKILGKYMPAPRANLVRVRAGIPNVKKDVGVYTSVERVNKRFFEKHFGSGNGHRYKAIRSSMQWLGASIEPYQELFDFSGAPPENAYQDLVHVIDVLNNTPEVRLAERLDSVFSINHALRLLTAGNALLNWDDARVTPPNGHNYYLYQNKKHNQMVMLPWDWDLGLSDPPGQPIDMLFNNVHFPLLSRLMMVPELKARYMAFMVMMAQELDWQEIQTWVNQYRSLAEADILSGEYEFFTHAEYDESLRLLEATVKDQQAFLLSHPQLNLSRPKISAVSHSPQMPHGNQAVTITAKIESDQALGEVSLFYRIDGSFQKMPMYDDGAHDDGLAGDGVFAATLPFQRPGTKVDFYVEAFTANQAAVWYYPRFTEFKPLSYRVLKTPEIGDVAINEIMAHSHGQKPDWIELHNTTQEPISIGNWYLSDSAENPQKYQIAPELVIPAKGFVVFYEDRHFGEHSLDPGKRIPFALSENGETLFLSSGDGETITGFIAEERFGASETGVALGRHYKMSSDTVNFVAMAKPTPGFANSLPQVGPIVISEIMYKPADNGDAEYLELLNIHSEPVTFFDFETQTPWQMTDGIQFVFPTQNPFTLAAGARILLVKDREAFTASFPLAAPIDLFEWDSGSLNNAGEKVELSRPGDLNQENVRQFIRVDRVGYEDQNPWPTQADGQGMALVRNHAKAYGNDVANWRAEEPSPGAENPINPKSTRLYPWISNREGAFESILVANNLSNQPLTAQLTALRVDGTSETVNISLPAFGFLEQSASQLFPNLGSGPGYSVRLTSADHLVEGVWVTHSLQGLSGKSPSQGVAVEVPSVVSASDRRGGTQIGFGYLPVADNFLSAPVVVNAGPHPVPVDLKFFNRKGLLVHSQTIERLNPGQPFSALVNGTISQEDSEVMMVAEAARGYLTGVSFVFNNQFYETAIGNATRLSAIATPAREKTLLYPWVSQRDGQFQSTLIAGNNGPKPLTVELVAVRETGPKITTSRTIPAGGFLAESAQTLFPTMGSGPGFSVTLKAPRSHVFGSWVSRSKKAASGDSPSQGIAIDVPSPGQTSRRVGKQLLMGYLPLSNAFFSAPVVVNLGTQPTDVTLYFFNANGDLILKDETSLRGLAPLRPYARLANLLLPPETGNVQVVAVAKTGVISGVVYIFNNEFAEPAIGNATAIEHWLAPEQ